MYITSLHFTFSLLHSLAHSTKVPFDGGVAMDLSVIAKLVPEYSVCALPHAVAFSRRDRRVSRSSVSGHMSNPSRPRSAHHPPYLMPGICESLLPHVTAYSEKVS